MGFSQRRSSLSIRTATTIIDQLGILEEKLKQAVGMSLNGSGGVLKPSATLYGKIEQANKWFASPFIDDNGVGHHAAVLVIDEARKIIAESQQRNVCSDEEMGQCVYETEVLLAQFVAALRDNNNNNSEHMISIVGKNCQDKFYTLGFKITKALIQQVADDFLDINHPLRKLVDVVTSPQGIFIVKI